MQYPAIVIVPDALRDGINSEIDRALAGRPCAPDERDDIYQTMLRHYAEHGSVPSITLNAKEADNGKGE